MQLIIDMLGSPNEKIWPSFADLPAANNFTFKHQPYNNLKQRFTWLSASGIRLLNNLFRFDPGKRISAEDCLSSSYFCEKPLPIDKSLMPSFPEIRNFQEAFSSNNSNKKAVTSACNEPNAKRKKHQISEKIKEHVKKKKSKKWLTVN
jgi:hypothetical protein